ncbi:hypothetical protein XENORESO_010607 [Xenotaenia resolanae]|uniref:Uncharacterized protein n=1 Tax=Xenotaenia resolanae TaxID=208358 RepID=A0ABV0VWG7_9TELE
MMWLKRFKLCYWTFEDAPPAGHLADSLCYWVVSELRWTEMKLTEGRRGVSQTAQCKCQYHPPGKRLGTPLRREQERPNGSMSLCINEHRGTMSPVVSDVIRV